MYCCETSRESHLWKSNLRHDHGQKLPPPAGKVIGFVDTKADFEALTQSLQKAGFPASRITSIEGEDGLHLLDRLKHRSFFFADSEDGIIQASIERE